MKLKRSDYIALYFCVSLILGYMYNIDTPQSLEAHLRQQPYFFTSVEYNLLYILPFLLVFFTDIPLGNLVDSYSTSVLTLVFLGFSFLSLFGEAIVLQMTPSGFKHISIICRCFFGIAGEVAFGVQGIILAKLAKENYEFLASCCWSSGYFGNSMSAIITTQVYDKTKKVSIPLFIGAVIGLYSFLSSIFLAFYLRKIQKQKQELPLLKQSQIEQPNQKIMQDTQIKEQKQNKSIFSTLKTFRIQFWILFIITFLTQCSMSAFVDNLNDLILKRFGFQYTQVGQMMMIPYGVMSIYGIIIGKILADNPTFRRKLLVLAYSLNFVLFIFFYYLPNTNEPSNTHFIIVIFFLLSMSIGMGSFYSGVMPLVPMVVPEKNLGLAWGVIGTAIALPGCVTPIIFAVILSFKQNNLQQGYQDLTLCGMVFSSLALISTLYLYFEPFKIFDKNYREISEEKDKDISLDQILNKYRNQ